MNKNKNNKKKKIGILIGGVLFIVIIICIILFKSESSKKMTCKISIDNYSAANIDINMEVYYTNFVNRINGQIYFKVTNEVLKENINELESNLKNYYNKASNNETVMITVYREDFNIIVDYDLNIQDFEEKDFETYDMFKIGEVNKNMTLQEFKNEIQKAGGNCVEEN